jgi:hypothetical protein
VASLTEPQLDSAGKNLRGYSLGYRKAILKRAAPQARVAMMRAHIQAFIDANPGLDGQVRDVLAAAQSVVTAEAVSEPTAADRASAQAVGQQLEQLLGRETAAYLLVWFGPRKSTFLASADPIRLKLTRFVRDTFSAKAAFNGTCDCVESWGCSTWGYNCSAAVACEMYYYFPQCGWFFYQDCNQLCVPE